MIDGVEPEVEQRIEEDLGPEFVDSDEPERPDEVELVVEEFGCDLCDEEFDTEKGLNIHKGRVHK